MRYNIIATLALTATTVLVSTSIAHAWVSNEDKAKAHQQYVKALTRHAGNRSTYLPRVGYTRADDYKNCIQQEYWKGSNYSYDEYDFCAWHAEIGKWQFKG